MSRCSIVSCKRGGRVKKLIVRLDEDYIVFRGGEHEAASAHLTGRLLLCLSEPLNIKHLRLHLTGISRVWLVYCFPVAGQQRNKNTNVAAGISLRHPLAEVARIGARNPSTKRLGVFANRARPRRRPYVPETTSILSTSSSMDRCQRVSRG